MPKKILIHSLIFSPDGVSTAYLYNDIALKFQENGYEVLVLTTTPHYNVVESQLAVQPLKWKVWGICKESCFHGIRVLHVPQKKFRNTFLRVLGFVYWHIISFLIGLFQRNIDVILSPSPPLTIGVINIWLAKIKGCKTIYNVQEIYPDILKRKDGLVIEQLRRMERYVYNNSTAVTTIDQVFYNVIAGRFKDKSKLCIIPNFVDTVLEHTISVFDNHPLIDEIAIVVHPNYLEKVEELCCINNFKKVGRILQGGSERYYSSLSAINAYASTENDINLIFHDSVRPLVTKRIISDCITMLGKYGAVDVAIPATDTIIKMNLNTHEIEDIPNRQFLYNGQTPQAFKLSVIREAYKRALVDPNFKTTDDCGVVLKYMPDIPIGVVPGEKFNMKLTHKEDLFLLDKLFQLKSVSDVSLYGQETALEHKVIVIFGGSYGIGHSIAELCTGLKAKVYSFSRSETGTDVADASLVKEALEKVYLIEKKIDFVINTAGILLKIPLMTMKYDDILNLIRVNYLGAINVAKESFSYLAKSHGGLLLFTSSSYTRGRAMYSLYSSSKAAIVNLVQALSEEWKSYNIKINCINPERTKTPMRIQNFGIEPENSLLSPQFVAETSIMTLLSGLTGQVIDVRRKTD